MFLLEGELWPDGDGDVHWIWELNLVHVGINEREGDARVEVERCPRDDAVLLSDDLEGRTVTFVEYHRDSAALHLFLGLHLVEEDGGADGSEQVENESAEHVADSGRSCFRWFRMQCGS